MEEVDKTVDQVEKTTTTAPELSAQKTGKTDMDGNAEEVMGTDNAAGVGELAVEEVPDEGDLTDVITLLNEVDKINGGTGAISEISPELKGAVSYIVGKLVALRDAFKDPLIKAILDDMVDQREDGAEPSATVAIARVVPLEEVQALADSEDYAGAQEALKGNLDAEAQAAADEETMYGNFEQSKKNIDQYVAEAGYAPEQAQGLYDEIATLRDIFADGLISIEEVAKIDKMRNYDSDIAALKSQAPEPPVKEVMPDKASVEASSAAKVDAKPAAPKGPRNSIEALGAGMGGGVDVTQVGKRKFTNRK